MNYPSKEEILYFHKILIDKSGGSHGIIDIGKLDKILFFVQEDIYSPDFFDKAA
ncbi:hypothetical protein [Persicobacter diffluens]|uniref:Uncharacterized protein n=1 Tax=Persicobacter diffluens TaxID=981 RepID=A0AAN4W0J2_9BACT|nr:hypothetical protein PEDI_29400 [Persicobacter diffluens]